MPEVGQLRPIEMRLLEELTGMRTGYVLDFSDKTFEEFFAAEVGINIYDDAYAEFGGSKGKRLRGFLTRAQRATIVRALAALWEYREDYLRRERRRDDVKDGLRGSTSSFSALEAPRLVTKPLPRLKLRCAGVPDRTR